jgi:hypothetical protein
MILKIMLSRPNDNVDWEIFIEILIFPNGGFFSSNGGFHLPNGEKLSSLYGIV